jgi:hypothetical protein
MGYDWVTHLAPLASLSGGRLGGIVKTVIRRDGERALCVVDLVGSSGFETLSRLLRDYSVFDLETTLAGRGSYTYFFLGEPGRWGLIKNFNTWFKTPKEDGKASIQVAMTDLLAAYDGPLFWRPDDGVLVIRGSYRGQAWVSPMTV